MGLGCAACQMTSGSNEPQIGLHKMASDNAVDLADSEMSLTPSKQIGLIQRLTERWRESRKAFALKWDNTVMLMIVGLVSCISAVVPAPVNDTTNTSYILATALFYKDASGRIMVANGPVPEVAAMAISADVSSRFNNATVKVVPAFNQPEALLNSSNIIDTFKNKYKTVFAIEVQKRLSRNAIVDWWNNLFHKTNKPKPKAKKRSTEIKEFMKTTQGLNSTSTTTHKPTDASSSSKERPGNTTSTTSHKPTDACSSSEEYQDNSTSTTSHKPTDACSSSEEYPENCTATTTLKPTEACSSSEECSEVRTLLPKSTKQAKVTTKSEVFSEEEDRLNEFFQGNEHSGEKTNSKRLRYFDQFVPNDIYYGVEKKCVNWSDGCGHHAGQLTNMTNLYLTYVKPRFPALPID